MIDIAETNLEKFNKANLWYSFIITLFLGLFHCPFAKAQDYGYRFRPPGVVDYAYGIQGGLGLGGARFSNIEPLFPVPVGVNHLQVSYNIGGFYEKNFSDKNYYVIELKFASRPALITFQGGSWQWNNTYFELPILFKRDFGQAFRFFGGFSLNKNFKASITQDEGTPLPFLQKTTNLKPYYKYITLTGILGVNYVINETFSLDLRFNQGLGNFAKPTDPFNGFHTKFMELSIRYYLPAGNKSFEYLRF